MISHISTTCVFNDKKNQTMKKAIYIIGLALFCLHGSFAQEYATFQITGTHQGTGSFINAALSGFSWTVSGTLTGELQILDNEIFDDGNAFENTFEIGRAHV